jgi:hypothetical protein
VKLDEVVQLLEEFKSIDVVKKYLKKLNKLNEKTTYRVTSLDEIEHDSNLKSKSKSIDLTDYLN